MPVLPIKYKREGYKLAGTSLPLLAHNYLVLYTLAKGTTKSKILTQLINNWIKRQKEKESESVLLQNITERSLREWKIKKANNGNLASFSEYAQSLHDELISKGLTTTQVDKILQGLKKK